MCEVGKDPRERAGHFSVFIFGHSKAVPIQPRPNYFCVFGRDTEAKNMHQLASNVDLILSSSWRWSRCCHLGLEGMRRETESGPK